MDADEMLMLDRQVCFALYSASRAFTSRYRPLLDELGLTYPQYLVMLVLWEEGPVSVKDLGRRLRLDSGTLSPLLKRLVMAGMITKTRSAEDERSVRVDLTTAGQELRIRAREVPPQMLCSTGLEPEELDRLRATLTLITEAVQQAAGATEGTSHA